VSTTKKLLGRKSSVEEVPGIISSKGRTVGQKIFNSFYSFVTNSNVAFININ
jgi:hypothetical protein